MELAENQQLRDFDFVGSSSFDVSHENGPRGIGRARSVSIILVSVAVTAAPTIYASEESVMVPEKGTGRLRTDQRRNCGYKQKEDSPEHERALSTCAAAASFCLFRSQSPPDVWRSVEQR